MIVEKIVHVKEIKGFSLSIEGLGILDRIILACGNIGAVLLNFIKNIDQ